jgi:hypothetical protein
MNLTGKRALCQADLDTLDHPIGTLDHPARKAARDWRGLVVVGVLIALMVMA